jgi:hypothetical protein
MVMKIQIMVLLIVMPCSNVVGYQYFQGPCCLHLQVVMWCKVPTFWSTFLPPSGEMKASSSSETLIFCHITIQHQSQPENHDLFQ